MQCPGSTGKVNPLDAAALLFNYHSPIKTDPKSSIYRYVDLWIDGLAPVILALSRLLPPFRESAVGAIYTDLHTRWIRVRSLSLPAWAVVTVCALSLVPLTVATG